MMFFSPFLYRNLKNLLSLFANQFQIQSLTSNINQQRLCLFIMPYLFLFRQKKSIKREQSFIKKYTCFAKRNIIEGVYFIVLLIVLVFCHIYFYKYDKNSLHYYNQPLR